MFKREHIKRRREENNQTNIKRDYHQYWIKKRRGNDQFILPVMKRTKVFSYMEVEQQVGDKMGKGSETVHGRQCLDGECLLGKNVFCARVF